MDPSRFCAQNTIVRMGPIIFQTIYCTIQRILCTIKYNWHFPSCICNIQFLCNSNEAYQISISKNKNSIFGELFHIIFMILYDNWSKNISDEFLKHPYTHLPSTSISKKFQNSFYRDFNVGVILPKFCKIDITLL